MCQGSGPPPAEGVSGPRPPPAEGVSGLRPPPAEGGPIVGEVAGELELPAVAVQPSPQAEHRAPGPRSETLCVFCFGSMISWGIEVRMKSFQARMNSFQTRRNSFYAEGRLE